METVVKNRVKSKKVSIMLTEREIAELKEISAQTGLGFSEQVRRSIDAYIKLNKEESNENGS